MLLLIAAAIGLYAQIYLYRRVSGLVQRQQTRWVIYGVALAFLGAIVLIPITANLTSQAKLEFYLQNNGKRFGRFDLGTRRNGSGHTVEDAKTLQENAQLIAAAIALGERTSESVR